mgnify:CR=1 FL=1
MAPTQEIYDLVNSVRERSFMAPMPPAVLTDANLMQEYIQRERRVELFYENWRYWATRLYMESDDPIELAKGKKLYWTRELAICQKPTLFTRHEACRRSKWKN